VILIVLTFIQGGIDVFDHVSTRLEGPRYFVGFPPIAVPILN